MILKLKITTKYELVKDGDVYTDFETTTEHEFQETNQIAPIVDIHEGKVGAIERKVKQAVNDLIDDQDPISSTLTRTVQDHLNVTICNMIHAQEMGIKFEKWWNEQFPSLVKAYPRESDQEALKKFSKHAFLQGAIEGLDKAWGITKN